MDSVYILGLDGTILVQKNYGPNNKTPLIKQLFKEYFSKRMRLDDHYPVIQMQDNWCFYLCSNDLIVVAVTERESELVQVFYHLYCVIDCLRDANEGLFNQRVIESQPEKVPLLLDHFYMNHHTLYFHKMALTDLVKPASTL